MRIHSCPGGESVEEITARVDRTIANIQEIHRRYKEEGVGKRDVMIFSHGALVVAMAYSVKGISDSLTVDNSD